MAVPHATKNAEAIASRRDPFVPPVFLVDSALRVRRALLRLADMVVPSYLAIMDNFMGAARTMLLHSVAKLHVADHLAQGPLSIAELASRTQSDPDALERVMLALVAIGFFKQESNGHFANNRISANLITGTESGVRGFAQFFGEESIIRAWRSIPEMLRTGKAGFDSVQGRSVWDWLALDDDARRAFVEGMSSMTEVVAPAIAAAYPFGEVKKVCDVGGGVGIVLAACLRKYPHLQGVLFESESMLGEARVYLDAHGIGDRVECVPGSFFDSVPRGADAYVMKTVLHNWPDDKALLILRNCRAAMDRGQRLVIADFLVEKDPISTLVPFMDLAGLMIFGGRERSAASLDVLFEQSGFRRARQWPLPGRQIVYEAFAV